MFCKYAFPRERLANKLGEKLRKETCGPDRVTALLQKVHDLALTIIDDSLPESIYTNFDDVIVTMNTASEDTCLRILAQLYLRHYECHGIVDDKDKAAEIDCFCSQFYNKQLACM